MKITRSVPCLVLGFVAVGAVAAWAWRPQEGLLGAGRTKPHGVAPEMKVEASVAEAFRAGDYAAAERILDANLNGPYGRSGPFHSAAALHGYKARLLARRGADAEALVESMDLLRGRYGDAPHDSRSLAPALEIAVKLGRSKEADEIATRIDANHEVSFSPFPCLDAPDPITTPARRLAYAYLVLADHAQGNMDQAARLRYLERAKMIAPNDVPVLFQLATAYQDREGKDDRAHAETLLRRAYALLPEGSSERRDLRNDAYTRTRIDPAGPQAKATLDADVFASVTENRLRNETLNAAKQREAARLREARGMPPLGATPPRP